MNLICKFILSVTVAFCCVTAINVNAQAEFANSSYQSDDVSDYNLMSVTRKLGRGISNVAFGVLEIPISMFDTNKENGGIAAVTYGPILGIAKFVLRELVGVAEIVTFPIPLPGCKPYPAQTGAGMGPILRPEWIIDLRHDAYNTVYPNTPIVN